MNGVVRVWERLRDRGFDLGDFSVVVHEDSRGHHTHRPPGSEGRPTARNLDDVDLASSCEQCVDQALNTATFFHRGAKLSKPATVFVLGDYMISAERALDRIDEAARELASIPGESAVEDALRTVEETSGTYAVETIEMLRMPNDALVGFFDQWAQDVRLRTEVVDEAFTRELRRFEDALEMSVLDELVRGLAGDEDDPGDLLRRERGEAEGTIRASAGYYVDPRPGQDLHRLTHYRSGAAIDRALLLLGRRGTLVQMSAAGAIRVKDSELGQLWGFARREHSDGPEVLETAEVLLREGMTLRDAVAAARAL